MALSDDPYDATELVAFINEVWTPMAQEQYFAKAVASNFFVDLSEFATGGGDIFHVPDYFTGTFSVQSQTTQATVVTTDAPPTTDTTLSINTHKYISTLLGYKDQQQLKRDTYNLSALNNRKAGGTLLHDLEDALFAAHSSVTTNAIGDTATVLTESEIRRAIEKLATLNVPLDECAFFFHPCMRLLWETIIEKFSKLRERLYYEVIRSQAQKWEGSETIMGMSFGTMG